MAGFLKELQLLLDPEQKDKPAGSKVVECVNMQGNRGEKSYAATVIEGGLKQSAKIVEKYNQRVERDTTEQTVVATAVTSNVKGKKPIGDMSIEIPQLVPPIKKRFPLRFFPNVAPRRDNRDFGKGLTITLKENGQRVVSRNNSAQNSAITNGLIHLGIRKDLEVGVGPTNKRGTWVPRQRGTGPLQGSGHFTGESLGQSTSLEAISNSSVGSRNRPTFEVGETSAKCSIGLEVSPKTQVQVQPIPEIKLSSTKSTKDILDFSSALATEARITSEKTRASFSSSNRQLLGSKWFIQLRDGGRMEIMGLEHSPWDFVRSDHGVGLGRWWSEMIELRSIFPMEVEEDLGVSCGENQENQERSVMVVDDGSSALVIEPLAVDWSLADQVTSNTPRLVNSKNDPDQPSDWVMGQLKKVGKALGASYEGNEKVVLKMLQNIEARKIQKGDTGHSSKRKRQSVSKGQRELRGLISNINYEPRTPESQRFPRDRALLIDQ
jgi:hypothetical protein